MAATETEWIARTICALVREARALDPATMHIVHIAGSTPLTRFICPAPSGDGLPTVRGTRWSVWQVVQVLLEGTHPDRVRSRLPGVSMPAATACAVYAILAAQPTLEGALL